MNLPPGADPDDYHVMAMYRDRPGFFYAIQIVPELSPHRIKLGYSLNPEQRTANFKMLAPTATVLRSWPCRSEWEREAIAHLAEVGTRLATELFDFPDLDLLIQRADAYFADGHAEVRKHPWDYKKTEWELNHPLRLARKAKGMTISQLSKATGVNGYHISQLEMNSQEFDGRKAALKTLAKYFGVKPDALIRPLQKY